jgi:hypothetical protein
VGTIGPVAVGVLLAFAWNLAVSQVQRAAGDESGVSPQVGLTVQQTAEQARARATPHGLAEHPAEGGTGHPAEGGAGGRQGTRPARSG